MTYGIALLTLLGVVACSAPSTQSDAGKSNSEERKDASTHDVATVTPGAHSGGNGAGTGGPPGSSAAGASGKASQNVSASGASGAGGSAGMSMTGGTGGLSGHARSSTTDSGIDGVMHQEIDISDQDETLLEHVLCNEFTSVTDSNTRTPSIVTRDGYAFFSHNRSSTTAAQNSRCDASGGIVNWPNYQSPDDPNHTESPAQLGAYAGRGNFFGFVDYYSSLTRTRVIAKFVDGLPTWTDNYDGRLLFGVRGLTSDGDAVYAIADAEAQLPGEPPGMTSLPVLFKETQDGVRSWIKRIDFGGSGENYAADPKGNVYVVSAIFKGMTPGVTDQRLVKVDANGEVQWDKDVGATPIGNSLDPPLSIAATDDTIFILSVGPTVQNQSLSPGIRVLDFLQLKSADAAVTVHTQLAFRHEKTIDPAAGGDWHGAQRVDSKFYAWSLAPLANGGVCLAGQYENTYSDGPVPREPHTDALIACFRGSELTWARQYRYLGAQQPNMEARLYPNKFAEQSDGSLLVVADQEGAAPTTGPLVFTLRANGDLM